MEKKSKPKISVIITIYKIENFLRQCIDSVISSTYKDIEVILVDDGSPDKCPLICDEYAKKDSRIKVIHQENQGSVNARRNGVKKSTGQYISLIDGDDWILPRMYEDMANILALYNSVDIIIAGYSEYDGEIIKTKGNKLKSGFYEKDNLDYLKANALNYGTFYTPGIVPALWCKLFRRDLIIDLQDYVPNILKMGDDAAITYSAIAASSKVVVDNEINSYVYRIRDNSLSRSLDDIYFSRASVLIDYLRKIFTKYNELSMINGLRYYNLFLYKIGVDHLFFAHNGSGFIENYQKIKTGSMIMKVKSDWNFFDIIFAFVKDDLRQIKELSGGHIISYIINKIINKFR